MIGRCAGGLALLVLLGCAAHPRPPSLPSAPEPFAPARDLGLVFVRGDGTAFLYTAVPTAPGTGVVIALPREGKVLRGQVSAERPPNEEYVQRPFGATVDAHRAMLRLQRQGEPMPALGVAVIGRPGVRLLRAGETLQAELDGAAPVESFRACASLEGAHLTVWSGRPLAGRRLWHVYYYLGYDTEEDCTPGDI